jgi:hypothetical protein
MSTIAKAAQATSGVPTHYEIDVTLEGKDVKPHLPDFMYREDTVHYRSVSVAGVVEIEFPEHSPFLNPDGSERNKVSSHDQPEKLKKDGTFICRCKITTDEGVQYPPGGWQDYPDAGGNHVVR